MSWFGSFFRPFPKKTNTSPFLQRTSILSLVVFPSSFFCFPFLGCNLFLDFPFGSLRPLSSHDNYPSILRRGLLPHVVAKKGFGDSVYRYFSLRPFAATRPTMRGWWRDARAIGCAASWLLATGQYQLAGAYQLDLNSTGTFARQGDQGKPKKKKWKKKKEKKKRKRKGANSYANMESKVRVANNKTQTR